MHDDSSAYAQFPDLDRRTVLQGLLASTAATGTSVTASTASAASTGDEFDRTDHVEIESFDETTLVGSLYEPTASGPHPAMLLTHGWGADRNADYVRRMAELYARNDYVVLTYDSRGFGESGGEVGLDGPKEVEDAQELVTWLARRENVQTANDDPDDPAIGMDSLSYAGGIQLNVAARDDRLDAIVPRWAWHDLVYSLAPNGVVKAGWASLLFAVGVTGSRGLTSGDGTSGKQDVRYGVSPKLHRMMTEATVTNRFSNESKAYLRTRSATTKLDDIDVPALFVSGWPDTLFTSNEAIWTHDALRERDVPTRLLFFQGGHTTTDTAGAKQRDYIDAAALEWVEAHVRGHGNANLPPVTYYETQTGEWQTADAMPPTGATTRTFALGDARAMDSTVIVNSVAPTSTSQLLPENRDLTEATAANFDFPLVEGFETLGTPELRLQVEPLGPETRLFTKLVHCHDGRATLLGDQVTPIKVEGEPGTVETADIEMTAVQRRFDAGDVLRFTVATTDAGFYPSRESAGARLYHSSERPSTLVLPATEDSATF
ncbi:CocE/NonD family hydrolase [Haladaptatus sp. NG-SE-30]